MPSWVDKTVVFSLSVQTVGFVGFGLSLQRRRGELENRDVRSSRMRGGSWARILNPTELSGELVAADSALLIARAGLTIMRAAARHSCSPYSDLFPAAIFFSQPRDRADGARRLDPGARARCSSAVQCTPRTPQQRWLKGAVVRTRVRVSG